MLPLSGDPRAREALEEALSFEYPPRAFLLDYEGARVRAAARGGGGGGSGQTAPRRAAPRRAAAQMEAFLRERYGRVEGLICAMRVQAVLVALAENWGELSERRLVAEAGKALLPMGRRHVHPALLEGLLEAEVTLLGGALPVPRLGRPGTRRAIERAARAGSDGGRSDGGRGA